VPTLGNNDEIRTRGQSGHFLMVRQRCQSVILAAQDQDWARERAQHVGAVLPFDIILPHESLWTKPFRHRPDPGDDVAIGEM
jgi:hypothetical protein